MKTEERILEEADKFVALAQGRIKGLEAALAEAQQRSAKKKSELEAARQALTRRANFQFKRDGDYQCPKCGIQRGIQAAMTPRPGQRRLDLFQCDTCGFDLDVPH
jgi:hypothetical protein